MSVHSQEIAIADLPGFNRLTVNGSLRPSRAAVNQALIGAPRATYTAKCQPATNPAFLAMVVTQSVGPFKVTGLRPAVQALGRIMADVKAEHPDIYERLGSNGMLCCRKVIGSISAISNHSWGIAIDLMIDGKGDGYNNGKVQKGLLPLWPIFNRHRFFWGISFPREDAMHFEASEQLVREWAKNGAFDAKPGKAPGPSLVFGDRGPQVLALQQALNRALAPQIIEEDGIFGLHTQLAVQAFQKGAGLAANGVASPAVMKALGLK